MKLIIYACECLLDHLIKMDEEEIIKYIMNHVIYSLTDRWLLFINVNNDFLFFCLRFVEMMRPFLSERIFCLKRSDLSNESCRDFIDFCGLNNVCQNCLQVIYINLKKYLVNVKK